MSFDLRNIIVYVFGLILLFVVFRVLKKPTQWALRFLLSCVFGIVALVLFNLVFRKFGIMLPLNPFNAVTVGVFGIPGIILLWVLAAL